MSNNSFYFKNNRADGGISAGTRLADKLRRIIGE